MCDTPFVVIDLPAVERHVARLQRYCDRHEIQLWPHVKAHKMIDLATLQLAAGAAGLTCQTVGEAEVMADAGFDRLLIPTPIVGERKCERLRHLAERVSLTLTCDSTHAARALARHGVRGEVLVELEVGLGRTGVPDAAHAARLAVEIAELDGLDFAGLLAHPTSPPVAPRLAEARAAIVERGLAVRRVSGGGTLYAQRAHECGISELRAGVYVFGDRSTLAAGATDDAALRIRSTVVSRPTRTRAIIDAGSKTLTQDPPNVAGVDGFGTIVEYPHATLACLSEEHGHVDLGGSGSGPCVGEVVTVIPNHACGVINLHDEVAVDSGDGPLAMRRVQARGRTA